MPYRLVWLSGRNTPQVNKVGQSRKKSTGGKVVASRMATKEEEARIRKGQWIRARRPGSAQTSSSGPYKYRKQLKKKAKGRKVK
jgi:hypothetical protein